MTDSGKVKGKQFFFEKKNQKTFAPETTHPKPARAELLKVFLRAGVGVPPFFQKSDRFAAFT